MKAEKYSQLIRSTSKKALVIMTLFSALFFSSCERYGSDGYSGRAFLSVNWDVSKPTYLDVGTSDIPEVFEWGSYYRAYPGLYTLDYEGQIWKGSYWANYNWQVDYEIYENPGERGMPNYSGRDGLNSYFDIVCTPYGPDITWYNAQIEPEENTNEMNPVTIIKRDGSYSIKITYKNVVVPYKPNKSKDKIDTRTSTAQ